MSGFNKIVELINKTGEKFVILDKNGDPCCAILPITEYEKFVSGGFKDGGLTEGEILDTINGDIENIREYQNNQVSEDKINEEDVMSPDLKSSFGTKYFNPVQNMQENDDNDDRYYFEPVE